MEEKERPNKERGVIRLMLVGLVVIVLVYLGYFILLNNNVLKHYATPENGVIGDTFGAINSLFSALAFLAIAASLYLQNQEFRLQREELELQRQEFKAAREEQANSQEAQRREMQLTRELHVRSNFEGRLMFLLKNLGKTTQEVKGNFWDLPLNDLIERTAEDYFNQIQAELHEFKDWEEFLKIWEPFPNDIFTLQINKYHLTRWRSPDQEFSIFAVACVQNIRQQECYQAFTTFLAVIDALQKEYDAWTQAGFGTQEEIMRHFESYVYLLKSSIPHSAFVYFMYVRSLPNGEIPYSIIHKMLLERFGTTDYLRKEHRISLLKDPNEKDK